MGKDDYSQRYRAYVLLVLSGVYTFNFIDRQILVIIQESVKLELGLSDTQLGMLTGLAFAIFYVGLGLPISKYADNHNRKNVVILSLAIWSAMTAVSGLVANYTQLLLARIGVGIGEAGGSGPSHSIISDYFKPHQRATALAVYSVGIYVGILAGYSLGGWIDANYGWRMAFFALGIPGVVYALFVYFTVKEPRKGRTDEVKLDTSTQKPNMAAALKLLLSKKTFVLIGLGAGFHTMTNYGVGNFLAPFLARVHGMPVAQIGVALGVSMGIGGMIGTFLGGYLGDRLGKKDIRWYLWLPILAATLNFIPSYFVFFDDNIPLVLIGIFVTSLLTAIYLGPCLAICHNLVNAKMRALSSALFFLALNIIGLGIGPTVTGILSDFLEPTYGNESLRYAFPYVFLTTIVSVILFYMASKHYPKEAMVSQKTTAITKKDLDMKPILQIVLGVFLLFFVGLFFLQIGLTKKSISELSTAVLGIVGLFFVSGSYFTLKGAIQGK
jgi:MFS family permease